MADYKGFSLKGRDIARKIEKESGIAPVIDPLSPKSKYSLDYFCGLPIEKTKKLPSPQLDRILEITLGHKLEIKYEPCYGPVDMEEVEKNLQEYLKVDI